MRTITGSCVLFLWMQALTFVKSQVPDCTLEAFVKGPLYDSNFDISGLDASYPGGKQVRVSCSVGFSGFFKLACVEGTWQSKSKKCQPKSCGHPGDAAFADFNLETGDDFVFGSKVVYTCHTGYQMVSRTNHRHCMAGGWDGVVPICEAQHCSVIHVEDNVQVTGDLEEATFSTVVRFSCKNRNDVLIGSQEIFCNEHGEWSDNKPKCEEIKCSVPVIENGFVKGDVTVYEDQEVLRYQCNPGFEIAVIGSTRCTKQGMRAQWIPTPACKLITCELSISTPRGTSYEPAANVFLPQDRLRVTCDADYWISDPQQTSAVTTCKENGDWTIYPVCKMFTCTVQNSAIRFWSDYWTPSRKIGEKLDYTCKVGYKSTGGTSRATCTRAGWRPDPQCEEITCDRSDYPNTNIVISKETYVYNERVDYVCTNGYEGEFSLTCGTYGWRGSNTCREKLCKKLYLNQAYIIRNNKQIYNHGDRVQYGCDNGMDKRFTVVCEAGVWTGIKQCTDSTECPEAEIQHGFATGAFNETLYYTCDDNYKLVTKGWWGEAKCVGGEWSGLEQCIEKRHCQVPVIPNGDMTHQQKYYEEGKSVQIVCKAGYSPQVQTLKCVKGEWPLAEILMKNICALIEISCSPPSKVDNAVIVTSYQKEYLSGSEVTYQCRQGYNIQGDAKLSCKDGEWQKRTIECKRTSPQQ